MCFIWPQTWHVLLHWQKESIDAIKSNNGLLNRLTFAEFTRVEEIGKYSKHWTGVIWRKTYNSFKRNHYVSTWGEQLISRVMLHHFFISLFMQLSLWACVRVGAYLRMRMCAYDHWKHSSTFSFPPSFNYATERSLCSFNILPISVPSLALILKSSWSWTVQKTLYIRSKQCKAPTNCLTCLLKHGHY
jgi:hypothetical protein